MKILLVSDEESPYFWDYYSPGKLKEFDLILSCGDLKSEYLSFLVTMGCAPLLYVHGNHDISYSIRPPEGCDCIDGKIVKVNGLRILGLGGSFRYNGGPHQYTEAQMRRRIQKLWLKIKLYGGVDIVLTHAPLRHFGDNDNLSHRGFEAFRKLLDKYSPAYLVHGHVHKSYGKEYIREFKYNDTKIINACGYQIIEI